MAALAPMPSANVSTTVTTSPLVRASERIAIFRSLTNDMNCSSFQKVGLSSVEISANSASVLPHLSERMSKVGVQLGIHATGHPKLLPVRVLLLYARICHATHCAILGCLAQIRTSSVVEAAGHVPRNSGLSQSIGELVQRLRAGHMGVTVCTGHTGDTLFLRGGSVARPEGRS